MKYYCSASFSRFAISKKLILWQILFSPLLIKTSTIYQFLIVSELSQLLTRTKLLFWQPRQHFA